MKKATIFTFKLAGFIIAIFSIAIVMTFINDAIQASGFFADIKLIKPQGPSEGVGIDIWHEWGTRHYYYAWMCFLLFCISIVRIIMWVVYFWTDKSKNDD